jgi:hypothetical protein
MSCLFGLDIHEHLLGIGRDDVERTITDRNDRAGGFGDALLILLVVLAAIARRGKDGGALGDDSFEELDGGLAGRSADVAHAVIVIIGEQTADLAVVLDALGPVGVAPVRWRRRWVALAEVIVNVAVVIAGIEGSDDAVPVRPFPKADVKGRADGGFLWRVGASGLRGGAPREFLRGEAFEACVG